MTRSQAIASCLIVGLLLSGAVAAQEAAAADLVTDRPDQTESAVVVPAGTLQIELGLLFVRESAGPGRVDLFQGPGTLLRWGLSERVELRLAWPGWIEVDGLRGPEPSFSGAGDPEIGTKLSFLSAARGDAFDLALLAHLSVPVGDEALGSPRADPSIRLNGAHELGERLGLGWNLGYETGSFEDPAGEAHTLGRFLYTVALGIDLSERWAMFAELFGDFPASDPEPALHSFDAGVTFLVTPRVQIDLSAGAGLNAEAPDWFAGAGVSFRVPR
jgi:hypothetical protein